MFCALCNETIEQFDLDLGTATIVDGECWHIECHAEYFDEALEPT